jgi:hypothetical protein
VSATSKPGSVPRRIVGHDWAETIDGRTHLKADWRELCRTVIEYGATEKWCVLPLGHDGPHVWGEERPK